MIIVTDTSLIVKWFVNEAGTSTAREFLQPSYNLAVPDFALAEVANALWRRQRAEDIDGDQVDKALQKLPMFFKHIVPTSELLIDGMRLARDLGHSIYDCLFLALSAMLPEGQLATADARFAAKVLNSDYKDLLLVQAVRPPMET